MSSLAVHYLAFPSFTFKGAALDKEGGRREGERKKKKKDRAKDKDNERKRARERKRDKQTRERQRSTKRVN